MISKDEERARRLAEALRQNLRRRKAQARGDDATSADSPRGSGPDSGKGDPQD